MGTSQGKQGVATGKSCSLRILGSTFGFARTSPEALATSHDLWNKWAGALWVPVPLGVGYKIIEEELATGKLFS